MNKTGSVLVAHCGSRKVTREELKTIEVPEATKTHQPLSHYEIVEVLNEALSFRNLSVVKDEYAVSADGMKMFGIMDLNYGFTDCRFSIGVRNANDKSMRLALTAGYRVFVCDNMAFSGDFTPLLHKHTKNLELRDSISIAVDRIHRGFRPLEARIRDMQEYWLTDNDARILIYGAFIDKGIKGIPKVLMPVVHDQYFQQQKEEFSPRTLWSLSNAFTSAFKDLGPIKQFEVTAKLGTFMTEVQADSIRRPEEPIGEAVKRLLGNVGDRSYEGYDEFLDDVEKARSLEEMQVPQTQDFSQSDDEADLAEALASVPDYFDEGVEHENMEEYERRAAA